MSTSRFKQEEYPAVADFITISFERDLPEFTAKYRTMNSEYLEMFKQSNTDVKEAQSGAAKKVRLKEHTKKLYAMADSVKDNIILLKDYAKRGGLDQNIIAKATTLLRSRNIEGAVNTIRQALPYYTERIEKLTDMPEKFLESMHADNVMMENLNAEQNKLMNEVKLNTADNKALYKNLQKYISDICTAGKIIFKNTPKEDEYIAKKVLSRARATKLAKAEVE